MSDSSTPLRILIAALGGEGGGVLMNWVVAAAREVGMSVQATSVPGVAQRTGSTSYYVEIADGSATAKPLFGLAPMPGRIDVLLCSELVEAGRMLSAGYADPKLTTLIASSSRVLTTTEKMHTTDGRYSDQGIRKAARASSKQSYILDLAELATKHNTFISATMFGALVGAGVLPWAENLSRSVFSAGKGSSASMQGFQAAYDQVVHLASKQAQEWAPEKGVMQAAPLTLANLTSQAHAKLRDYQNDDYASLYDTRIARLQSAASGVADSAIAQQAIHEAARRLSLWMAYEDVARVADLKTSKARFATIRKEIQLQPGQIVKVTEYLKPRAEEIADVLPYGVGKWIMARLEKGGKFPFLGRPVHMHSSSVFGYWSLRLVSKLALIRPSSYRYRMEQQEIEKWLLALQSVLVVSPEFALNLAELPRLIKGYSDTLAKGKKAYLAIMQDLVLPAVETGTDDWSAANSKLRTAMDAALSNDGHKSTAQAFDRNEVKALRIVNLGNSANAS